MILLLAPMFALSTAGVTLGGWSAPRPLDVEIVRADGTANWTCAPYARVTKDRAEGATATPHGTRLRFTDRYRALPDGFVLDRTVRVLAVGVGEVAFSTRFTLATAARLREREMFMPGVAYRHNEDAPKGALAGDPDAARTMVREDRLPLPLAALRDPSTGETIELVHQRPDGATFAGEDGPARLVDERMRFGSLGYLSGPFSTPGERGRGEGRSLAIAFEYPGSEGDRHPSLRSHPLRVGFEQRYRLRATLSDSETYADAVQATWRRAFADADPRPPKADLARVEKASLDLLARVAVRYHGVPSVPFQLRLPSGEVVDTSSQMGFVGKALPAAALLMRDAKRRRQAEDVLDFWTANATTPFGVPRTWYDIHDDGSVTWRPYTVYLRIACDGTLGLLDAHRLDPHPAWLAFARRWGDFLLDHAAEDGSLPAGYDSEGRVTRPFTNATDHAIPFLAALFRATGDARFRKAAVRAGEFSLTSIDAPCRYVGGAPDNPNVTDKEAGVLAMEAFLALYSLTREPKWIAPAARAATFAETWTYAWDVPIPKGDPKVVYPPNRTTLGLSLIATGHSGADDFMAIAVDSYYRLWLLTQDPHFLRFARFLERSTKQMVDWDGTLGYAHPGLLSEALGLAYPRGHGVGGWLPWLTVAVLQPLVRLRETFGSSEIDRIERLPLAERLRRAYPAL